MIATQRNLYAEQFMEGKTFNQSSRFLKWTPVTINEIKVYIALVLYRGVIWKPSYEFYYMTDPIFSTPMMSRVMSYNRFHLIDKFLHFVDNKSLDKKYEKIAKIKPIYQYLFERFRTLYIPERDISIDESLLLWKGRLSWKQYIPNKRARFGLKSFVLCESSTEYIWNGKLCTGKELTADLDQNYGQFHYMGTKIIVDLMNDALLDKGYRLHIDNWYTSFEVVKHLLDHKTNCIGTL